MKYAFTFIVTALGCALLLNAATPAAGQSSAAIPVLPAGIIGTPVGKGQ